MNESAFLKIIEGLSCSDYDTFSAAEMVFNELLSENKEDVILSLINVILNVQNNTIVNAASVLLQRMYSIFSPSFLTIGNENYHKKIQKSLQQIFTIECDDPHILKCLAHTLSCFAAVYLGNWPEMTQTLIESLKSDSYTARLIASECLWKCISDNTISSKKIVFQCVFDFLNETIYNYNDNILHLLLAGTRLAFFIHRSAQNDEISNLSIPIISLFHNMKSERKLLFLENVGYLADIDLSFFSPSICEIFKITIFVLTDQLSPIQMINTAINILDKIIIKKIYGDVIKHHKIEIFDLMVNAIRNAIITEGTYDIKNKPITLQVAEDLLFDLSRVCYMKGDFFINITNHFNSTVSNVNEEDVFGFSAFLIAYVSIVEGSEKMFADLYLDTNVIPTYLAALRSHNHDARLIAVELINRLLILIGADGEECECEEVFPSLLHLISIEPCFDIIRMLIKCITTYVKMFDTCQPFIPTLVEIFEANYERIDCRLRSKSIECYKFAYKRSPENFPCFEVIYRRVSNVLSDTSLQNHSIDMFFACMKFTSCVDQMIPTDLLAENSANIFSFISSADFTTFSSRQLDSINKVVRAILKRTPDWQITPYAKSFMEFVIASVTKDIIVSFTEQFGTHSSMTKSSALTKRFNSVTKEIEFFLNSDIEFVLNSLVTLKYILTASKNDTIVSPYINAIFEAVCKVMNDGICPNIISNAFAVVSELIKFINFETTNSIQIAHKLLITTINSLMVINQEDYIEILKTLKYFRGIFLELSKVAANEEILAHLLALIQNFYLKLSQESYQIIPENQRTDFLENITLLDEVEKEISYLFPIIFQHYSDFYDSFHQNIEETFFLRPMNDGTVSRTVLHFWCDYALYYQKCSLENFGCIFASLKDMVAYCMSFHTNNISFYQNVISSYITLLSSSRLPTAAALSELPFICQFLYSESIVKGEPNLFSCAQMVARPIMLITARLIDENQDPTEVLCLLLDLIGGLIFLAPEPCDELSVRNAFLVLTQTEHPLLVSIEGKAALFFLATRLLSVASEKEVRLSLSKYIVALTSDVNWIAIGAAIREKCNNITKIHVGKCVDEAVSIMQQALL